MGNGASLFRGSPPEIQNMILDHADDPAFVVIEVLYPGGMLTTRASRRAPATLLLNHEGRDLASLTFRRMFNEIDYRPRYFNPRIDVLHLHKVRSDWQRNLWQDYARIGRIIEDFRLVRHLAIYGLGNCTTWVRAQGLINFPRLETLRLQTPNDQNSLLFEFVRWGNWATNLPRFWTNEMHTEQARLNLPITPPPRIIWLTDAEIAAFNAVPTSPAPAPAPASTAQDDQDEYMEM